MKKIVRVHFLLKKKIKTKNIREPKIESKHCESGEFCFLSRGTKKVILGAHPCIVTELHYFSLVLHSRKSLQTFHFN